MKKTFKLFLILFILNSLSTFSQKRTMERRININTPVVKYGDYLNKLKSDSLLLGKKTEVLPSLNYNEAEYNSKLVITEEELNMKKEQITSLSYNKSSSSPSNPYSDDAPIDISDKYTLKPNTGSLATGLPNFSEDLHHGKVNISIPLFNFKYYDYQIPVFLNNKYPQVISQAYGEPTFYTTSKVGGDWTLSIDQFKVTRQVNGIEDEHPSKGYFSSFSQSKVNNPASITNSQIKSGLKGDWDPAIDVFHFSTPTLSGSFLINISDGSYEILSKEKFHVEFEIKENKIHEFIITDNNGIKYIFGGSSDTIEVSQSVTDSYNIGSITNSLYSKFPVEYIIETENYYSITRDKPISIKRIDATANLFCNLASGYFTQGPFTNSEILDVIYNTNSISGVKHKLTYLGSKWDEGNNITREYYALPAEYSISNNVLLDKKLNDSELRRNKLNTGWYLKEIVLKNNKKINFLYSNYYWEAYPTYGSNRITPFLATSNQNSTFYYISSKGSNDEEFYAELNGLDFYPCYPNTFKPGQFPLNESHTVSYNFVKRPSLFAIYDDDNFSDLRLHFDINNPRPYVVNPIMFEDYGAPSETIPSIGNTSYDGLYSHITLNINGESNIVRFKNHAAFGTVNYDGVTYREPHNDRSYLEEVIVNTRKKFTFDYEGSRLKKIHYPTGATKEFSFENINTGRAYYNTRADRLFEPNTSGYRYSINEAAVSEVITTSEENTTTESYSFSGTGIASGAVSTLKTLRPGIDACTSTAIHYSTSQLFPNHSTRGGLCYGEATKTINGEKQFKIAYTYDGDSTWNQMYLTDESTPSYLNDIGRPRNSFDEKAGLIQKNTIYKTDQDSISTPIKEITFTRTYQDFVLKYPSIYLNKIEIGPWQDTSGAIKKGYSTYHYPIEYNILTEEKINTDFFDTGNLESTTKDYFKRTEAPSNGLNIHRLTKTENTNYTGDVMKTELYSPIEIENIESSVGNINIENAFFNDLLSNNIVPTVETLTFNNNKLVNASSTEFKSTPNDPDGNNFTVPHRQKSLELEDTILNGNNFVEQHIDAIGNIIYDSNLKNKIIYDRYDSDGRILEYHVSDGSVLESQNAKSIYTSIIWSYKKQLPVAVIKNARYSEVEPFVETIQSKHRHLKQSDFEDLRNSLPNAQITTYTYKGTKVTSMSNPRGEVATYEYNELNELELIKDTDGNIVEKYTYNYKTLSNAALNFRLGDINLLNPSNYLIVGGNLYCNIIPHGGSGSYTFSWRLKKGNDILTSGSSQYSNIELLDNYSGSLKLIYTVTDNVTGVELYKYKDFYVYAHATYMYPTFFENISENNIYGASTKYSTATVTNDSPMNDVFRFWVFNRSSAGDVTVTIDGASHSIGYYETKFIEVPINSGETVNCRVEGQGLFTAVTLEIKPSVHGAVSISSPDVLNLSR